MASDLSSGCMEPTEVLDEKEEGEISLEDVSSSEEGHIANYGYARNQCPNCLSTQHCATWCVAPPKHYCLRNTRRDAVQGKENRHHVKESGCTGVKHTISTLQEKNDDLVPISSDSDMDMEIIGLLDNSAQMIVHTKSSARVKKKRKKKRTSPKMSIEDLVSSSSNNDCISSSHRSGRSRLGPRSPPRRRRSPIRVRSPFKKSRSPFKKSRSPILRGRSPSKASRKLSRLGVSHGSHGYADGHGHVNELLKKVRQLDTIGVKSLEESLNKNREYASSLKDKLTKMMKGVSDNNGNVPNYSSDRGKTHEKTTEMDDEEDLALLRQKALATKQRKASKHSERPKAEPAKKPMSLEDDQDEEDLQLRMIALRSAVLKKHQNRVQKGMKCGKSKNSSNSRSESPFTQSFLDSIPIPGEQLLSLASPPQTPHSMNENNHTEDMELDTDVEREKEKLPYSPTDKITIDMSMDTELLGIQSSDVSFISLNDATNSPALAVPQLLASATTSTVPGKIVENQSYLPNVIYYGTPQNMYEPNLAAPYSPSDPIVTPQGNFPQKRHAIAPHYPVPCNTFGTPTMQNPLEASTGQEIPYSPSNVLQSLPQTPLSAATSNTSSPMSQRTHVPPVHRNYNRVTIMPEASKIGSSTSGGEEKTDSFSMEPVIGSAATSVMGSLSPSYSMITIDDLPEIGSPANDVQKAKAECGPQNLKEIVPEPLYMQGVPDITKDANKIPTLINRTLVPAPILKSNKQLQQPLITRKPEGHLEPTFKSAEMQPVMIEEEAGSRTSAVFKPMKLISHTQKPASVLVTPVAFHDSMQEESIEELRANASAENKEETAVEGTGTTESNVNSTASTSNRKRKKSPKVPSKRKSSDAKKHELSSGESKRKSIEEGASIKETVQERTTPKETEVTKESKKTAQKNTRTTEDAVPLNSNSLQSNAEDGNVLKDHTTKKSKGEELETKCNSPEGKTTENRRQSLDEDEEELRAILLASLPKRQKGADAGNSSKTTDNATAMNSSKPASPAPSAVPNKPIQQSENIQTHLSETNETVKTLQNGIPEPTLVPRKRTMPVMKGPQKKVLKKVPIPASTKVVNNAKKYQNAILQKRMNLQKVETGYSNQQLTDNKLQITKTPQVSETQRIVINLESDTESDSEPERQKTNVVPAVPTPATVMVPPVVKHQPIVNRGTFEKNLNQFLRDVRKKQESVAAARAPQSPQPGKKEVPTTPTEKTNSTNTTNLHTPLAVRHLPASQQEEYRRLKQQIMEREKLKMRRTMENNPMLKNKAALSPKSNPSDSPIKRPVVPKVQPAQVPKNQTMVARQLNKENNSKPEQQSTTITVAKVEKQSIKTINSNKTTGGVIHLNTGTKQLKNFSIRISNENAIPNTTDKDATLVKTGTREILRSTPPPKENTPINISPGLKVLSKDEVNQRYEQKESDRTVTETSDETGILEGKVNENIGEDEICQFVENVEKEIVENNSQVGSASVDSDASTIILPRNRQNVQCGDSVNSSQSTVLLSQIQENTQSPDIEDESNLSTRNNSSVEGKMSIEENWDIIRQDVKIELNALNNLSAAEQERFLSQTEQELVMKRYTILDELADMSGSLRQWHMERDIQLNLVVEVKKLREQLRVAEEQLQLQRNRTNSIGPRVIAAHKKINAGRQECFKLSQVCSVLGSRVVGKDYKVPEAGAQLLENRLKEVANHTRQLSRKKVPSIDIPEMNTISPVKHQPETTTANMEDVQSQSESVDLSRTLCETDTTVEVTTEPPCENSKEQETTNEQTRDPEEEATSNATASEPVTEQTSPTEQDETMFNAQPDQCSTPVISRHKETIEEKEKDTEKEKEAPDIAGPSLTLATVQESQPKKSIAPYVSILTHFKVPRNTNPNGVLCPYELMGTCNDAECQFVHHPETQAN